MPLPNLNELLKDPNFLKQWFKAERLKDVVCVRNKSESPSIGEVACPNCNPEAKPRIRRLNKSSICLICYNTGWTRTNKVCQCGLPSGIHLACDVCSQRASEALRSRVIITKCLKTF